jgi:hypothetical protein
VKTLMLTLALTVVAADAQAISRYNSQSMSCAKVQATLRNEGAAILRYRSARSGSPLYGRYVATASQCEPGQHMERRYVPTADDARCPVQECEHNDYTAR